MKSRINILCPGRVSRRGPCETIYAESLNSAGSSFRKTLLGHRKTLPEYKPLRDCLPEVNSGRAVVPFRRIGTGFRNDAPVFVIAIPNAFGRSNLIKRISEFFCSSRVSRRGPCETIYAESLNSAGSSFRKTLLGHRKTLPEYKPLRDCLPEVNSGRAVVPFRRIGTGFRNDAPVFVIAIPNAFGRSNLIKRISEFTGKANHTKGLILGAILSFLCLNVTQAQENGTLYKWQKGIVKNEFIYEEAPFPSCHSATIAETPTGLVYSFFGGTHERHPDVEIYVCRYENGKWTAPVSVANGIQENGKRLPTWNPVLYQIPNGDLLLFYKIGPKPSEWWGMLKRSKDGGKTWSEAEKLPEGYIGPVKNKPVLLSNGNLISPSSTEHDGWKIHFEITPDFGKTWRTVGPLTSEDTDMKAIQPSVLDHGNGKLQILARTRNWAIAESWSYDNGETWTPLKKTTLPNNNSGTDAVTMKNGKHVLVYNHVLPPKENPKGKRTPLNVSVSKDGINWKAALILEDSPISQYSYPAVIQTSDGLLHFAYTWRRLKMKHVVVDPSKMKLKKIKNGVWPKLKGYTVPKEEEYKKEED